MPDLISKLRSSGNGLIDGLRSEESREIPEKPTPDFIDIITQTAQEKVTELLQELIQSPDFISSIVKGILFSNVDRFKGPQGEKGMRGEKGEAVIGLRGRDGKDGREILAEEIVKKLQSLVGEKRLDASAIKNLPVAQFGSKIIHRGGIDLIFNETPSGTVNGSNTTFTLANTPKSGSLQIYLNGMRMQLTGDYTLSGKIITLLVAPPTGSIILVDYQKT